MRSDSSNNVHKILRKTDQRLFHRSQRPRMRRYRSSMEQRNCLRNEFRLHPTRFRRGFRRQTRGGRRITSSGIARTGR